MTRERMLWAAFPCLALLAVVLIGGVHPSVQVLLSSLALVACLLVVRARGRRGLRLVPLLLPALVAIGWTAVQLVPLPAGMVRIVSPAAFELRSELGAGWMPLTLDVPATLLELVKMSALLAVFVCVATLARSSGREQRTLEIITWLGAVLALVSFEQRITGAQTIFGLYHPSSPLGRGVVGTFVNGNHAASVMSLSALVGVGLAIRAHRTERAIYAGLAALSALGVFVTTSRFGALSLCLGGVVLAVALAIRSKNRRQMLLGVGCGVLVVVGLLWVSDGLRTRLMASSLSDLVHSAKVTGWRDGVLLSRSYLWTGAGRGAFEAAVEAYREHDLGVRLVFPENVVVQMLSEWGLPMTLLLAGLILFDLRRLVSKLPRADVGIVAAACGVFAVAVHELADFGLETLGVALPFVVVLGFVVGRLAEHQPGVARWRPRGVTVGAAAGAWVLVLAGGVWASGHTLARDVESASACMKNEGGVQCRLDSLRARHPASDHFDLLEAEIALRSHDDASAIAHLNRALRLHRANGWAHRIAALALVHLHRPAQAALEYRLAAENGRPAADAELLRYTGKHVVDAVPQQKDELLHLANLLANSGRVDIADAAAQRAVDLKDGDVETMLYRLRLMARLKDQVRVGNAAQALLLANPPAPVEVEIVTTLEAVGDTRGADAALRSAIQSHPADASLLVAGVRLLLTRGDLEGAQGLLSKEEKTMRPSLDERRVLEELRGDLAEKRGDLQTAQLARDRARILSHRIRETELR